MAIDSELVKQWLQEEGIYFQDRPQETWVAQWAVRVPIDPQQSINLILGVPKAKEDALVAQLVLIPGDNHQEIISKLEDAGKQKLFRELTANLLEHRDLAPVFEQGPDNRLQMRLSKFVFEDAPITKHAVMSVVGELTKSFLFYEVVTSQIIDRFGPESEYLKP